MIYQITNSFFFTTLIPFLLQYFIYFKICLQISKKIVFLSQGKKFCRHFWNILIAPLICLNHTFLYNISYTFLSAKSLYFCHNKKSQPAVSEHFECSYISLNHSSFCIKISDNLRITSKRTKIAFVAFLAQEKSRPAVSEYFDSTT